jgi:outer membrane lipoprotein-sorting protein
VTPPLTRRRVAGLLAPTALAAAQLYARLELMLRACAARLHAPLAPIAFSAAPLHAALASLAALLRPYAAQLHALLALMLRTCAARLHPPLAPLAFCAAPLHAALAPLAALLRPCAAPLRALLALTAALLLPGVAPAAPLDARGVMEEVQRRSFSRSFRYEGRVQVRKADGRTEEKSWKYERLGPPGAGRVMLRFTAPAEIRGVALLVWNHAGRPADIWLYTPSIGRHRRIAQQDRSTKFAGTDFSFEDVEEDDLSQWDYSDLADDVEAGEPCWRLSARRKVFRRSQYDRNQIWISKQKWTPLRMDKWKDGRVIRRVHMQRLELRQNIWTPMLTEIADLTEKSRTTLQLFSATYDARMNESAFTLEAMKGAW